LVRIYHRIILGTAYPEINLQSLHTVLSSIDGITENFRQLSRDAESLSHRFFGEKSIPFPSAWSAIYKRSKQGYQGASWLIQKGYAELQGDHLEQVPLKERIADALYSEMGVLYETLDHMFPLVFIWMQNYAIIGASAEKMLIELLDNMNDAISAVFDDKPAFETRYLRGVKSLSTGNSLSSLVDFVTLDSNLERSLAASSEQSSQDSYDIESAGSSNFSNQVHPFREEEKIATPPGLRNGLDETAIVSATNRKGFSNRVVPVDILTVRKMTEDTEPMTPHHSTESSKNSSKQSSNASEDSSPKESLAKFDNAVPTSSILLDERVQDVQENASSDSVFVKAVDYLSDYNSISSESDESESEESRDLGDALLRVPEKGSDNDSYNGEYDLPSSESESEDEQVLPFGAVPRADSDDGLSVADLDEVLAASKKNQQVRYLVRLFFKTKQSYNYNLY
jgi:hypothetical protein